MALRRTPGWESDDVPVRVVGRRGWRTGLAAAAPLLELAVRLRGDKPFVPRGVHRFASFEEADEWALTMMTRPSRRGPRSSPTSSGSAAT